MGIHMANTGDLDWLAVHDRHIAREVLQESIAAQRVLIAEEDRERVGWLRWNLFWDNTPFMNLLYVLDGWRGQGVGAALVNRWEGNMAALGYRLLLTSTQSDETAQHFYRKLGWRDAGVLLLPGETMELFFVKGL